MLGYCLGAILDNRDKMSSKHFIDDPTHLVQTSLSALTLINPSVAFDSKNRIVYRRPTKELTKSPKVSIITGGGSGHEPVSLYFDVLTVLRLDCLRRAAS